MAAVDAGVASDAAEGARHCLGYLYMQCGTWSAENAVTAPRLLAVLQQNGFFASSRSTVLARAIWRFGDEAEMEKVNRNDRLDFFVCREVEVGFAE